MKAGDIIKLGKYKKPIQSRVFNCLISPEDFARRFLEAATSKIHSSEDNYIVDDQNKEAINQLYFFLVNDSKFTGDPIKGILLAGAIGSGKTVLIESFLSVFNDVSGKVVISVSSRDIVNMQDEKGYDYLNRRPLFIDDIGKEQTVINTYGTISKPMEDLLDRRYKSAGLTFGTTNLKIEDMPYNKHTIDRMRQMFNIIELPGKSRRS